MDYRDLLARIPGSKFRNDWQPTPFEPTGPGRDNNQTGPPAYLGDDVRRFPMPRGTQRGGNQIPQGGAAPLPKPPVSRPAPGMGAAVPQDAAPTSNQAMGRRMSPGNLSPEAQDFLSKLFQAKRNGYQIQQEKDGQISISLPKKTGSIKEMMGLLGR